MEELAATFLRSFSSCFPLLLPSSPLSVPLLLASRPFLSLSVAMHRAAVSQHSAARLPDGGGSGWRQERSENHFFLKECISRSEECFYSSAF